ncbi:VWA domain-containing protein [Bacillus dakarensis]|uniref:VWA domain-containing protein n=1 Tax=Robertmurraya dakarensis TaxID=1926278 RepID=UPI000980970C|nr:VWA domain-containing protein [Bacillus dakarensis]
MRRLFLFVIVWGLFLAGCSGEDQHISGEQEELPADEKIEEKVEEVPEEVPPAAVDNVHEIVKEQGKYDVDEVNKNEELKAQLMAELKDFPDNLSGEEAYNRVIPLIAADIKKEAELFEAVDPVIKFDSSSPDNEFALPETETVNVAILLDASGSMAGQVSGGQKMKLAKEAIKNYASDLPEGSNVMLRVYGHKGTGSDADKELSCSSHEVVFPLGAYEEGQFESALNQFAPAGWTPLAGAIEEAKKDLESQKGENVRNVIYIVSDGIETCDGDPVAAAKALYSSDIQAEVNIIGFDVDNEGQAQLKEVAEAGGGVYKTVYSESDLNDYLKEEYSRLYWEWLAWSNDRYFDVLGQSNDIYFDMLGYTNDIYFKSLAEKNMMSTIRYELKDLGKFKDGDAADEFMKLARIRHETVDQYFDQEEDRKNKIRKELKEKYQKLIKEKKEENLEKYSS